MPTTTILRLLLETHTHTQTGALHTASHGSDAAQTLEGGKGDMRGER